jgi:predicted Zn-dependent peptidase
MVTHHKHTLKNGLPVLLVEMPSVQSVTALVLTNTGSRYEVPEQAGIAHFFEHMVFKGTEKYGSAQDLASAIDAIGADFNAFTSKEYTGYYVKSASQHLGTSLDVLSDMLLRPLLKQEDIDREKGVIIEEINMYKDNPMHHVANLFEQMAYADFGLNHDIIGTRETVSSLTTADFQSFLSSWYGLPNMLLVLAGDATVLKDKHTLKMIEAAFSKPTGQERVKNKVKLARYYSKEPLSESTLHVEHRPTEQAHVILGWKGLPRTDDENRPILSLLGTLMGGNMSSRLFSEVREKRGLCYYVHSDVDYYHEVGLVGASAGVDPKRVYEAIEVIRAEFAEVATGKKPVTDEELNRAKEYIRGTMTLSFEDSRSVGQSFGMKELLLDRVETLEESLAKMQAVTLDQVNNLASTLFKNANPKLAVIGPFEDKAKFEELIK